MKGQKKRVAHSQPSQIINLDSIFNCLIYQTTKETLSKNDWMKVGRKKIKIINVKEKGLRWQMWDKKMKRNWDQR